MSNGVAGKILRVNLTKETVQVEQLPELFLPPLSWGKSIGELFFVEGIRCWY